jgi:hypothetical protein
VIPDALKIISDASKVTSNGPALLFFSSISTDRRNRPLQSLRRYKICRRIFTPFDDSGSRLHNGSKKQILLPHKTRDQGIRSFAAAQDFGRRLPLRSRLLCASTSPAALRLASRVTCSDARKAAQTQAFSRTKRALRVSPAGSRCAHAPMRLKKADPSLPLRTSPAGSDARKAAQIVKEHLFWLPGQPLKHPNISSSNIL